MNLPPELCFAFTSVITPSITRSPAISADRPENLIDGLKTANANSPAPMPCGVYE